MRVQYGLKVGTAFSLFAGDQSTLLLLLKGCGFNKGQSRGTHRDRVPGHMVRCDWYGDR